MAFTIAQITLRCKNCGYTTGIAETCNFKGTWKLDGLCNNCIPKRMEEPLFIGTVVMAKCKYLSSEKQRFIKVKNSAFCWYGETTGLVSWDELDDMVILARGLEL